MTSPQLNISLVDWRNISAPNFTASAFLICDFYTNAKEVINTSFGPLEGVIFTGSYNGEVLRWIIHEKGATPVTVAFGHFSKIVQFAECAFPIVQNAVVSLSYDGTICVWSVIDGICIRNFANVLPNGCQRIAVSNSAIETAAISGSFPNIYIFNIQTGQITQIIRPVSTFAVCLDFYSTKEKEWLFVMDANCCATYTTLTPTTSTSHRIGILQPQKDLLIGAYPSPDFSFIVLIFPTCYAVVALFEKSFPSLIIEDEYDLMSVVWLDSIVFVLFKNDGSFVVYQLTPPNRTETHATTIESIEYSKHSPSISSVLQNKTQSDILKFKSKQLALLNPLNRMPDSFSRLRTGFHTKGRESSEKYEFKLSELWKGCSNIPMPLVSAFGRQVAFAFDDCVILTVKQYDTEYNLFDVFTSDKKKEDLVTAQCYYLYKKSATALIEGRKNGIITIKYFTHNMRKKRLKVRHHGRVVALCTKKKFLFTSGKDCVLNVISLDTLSLLTVYSHFVSPVTQFLSVSKKTHTSIDNCLFCVTSDGKISVVDISTPKTSSLFILTGHESKVEHIFFHPPTKLLLVQCRSLYFWSMITGNLESIMNGHQMFKYIENAKGSLIEISKPMSRKCGIRYIPTRFGSLNLRVPEINVNKLAEKVRDSLIGHENESLTKALSHIPNFPLIFYLLSGRAQKFITSEVKADVHMTDSRLSFSGAHNITTVYLTPFKGKMHWQISPQVTTTILSVRIVLSHALKKIEFINKNWTKFFRTKPESLFKNIQNFQEPDLFYLFKFCLNAPFNIHNYIYRLIQMYPIEVRSKWASSLIDAVSLFPNQKDVFLLISQAIYSTVIEKLTENQLQTMAKKLYDLQTNKLGGIGSFSREVIGFCIEKLCKFIPDIKILLFNVLRESDYQTNETNTLDYYVQILPKNCLDYSRSFLAKNTDKKWNDFIFGNITRAIIKYPRNNFIEDCAILLAESFQFASLEDILPHYNKLINSIYWFCFRPEPKMFVIGFRSGNIFVLQFGNGRVAKGDLKFQNINKSIESVTIDKKGSVLIFSIGINVIRTTILQQTTSSEDIKKQKEMLIKATEPTRKVIPESIRFKWENDTMLNLISQKTGKTIEVIDTSKPF